MKKIKILLAAFFVCLLTGNTTFASKSIWMDNFDIAKKKANVEGKDILIGFTGSDWCQWCIKLEREVFCKQAFIDQIQKDFVLLKIDFPETEQAKTEQTDQLKRQNDELKHIYDVKAFPTIFLVDHNGLAYAKTGYGEGGVEKYLAHIKKLKTVKSKRDELLLKADGTRGIERAQLLDRVLILLGKNEVHKGYDNYIEEINLLDKDNKAGLKQKYKIVGIHKKADKIMRFLSDTNDYIGAGKQLDSLIRTSQFSPELVQQLYVYKAEASMKYEKDKETAKSILRKAVSAAPNTNFAKKINAYMSQMSND